MAEPCRKPNLLDAMILIAAGAVGLGLGRAAIIDGRPRRALPPSFRFMQALQDLHAGAVACVLTLSIALVVIRLRRPRPPILALLKQPGWMGCVGSTVMTLATGICWVWSPGVPRLSDYLFFLSTMGAWGVILGWMSLILAWSWRPEPGWIDRAGRVLSLCWIALVGLLYLSFAV